MNIAYCEDEKIQLEYMEQLIKKWADEGNDTVTYFGYGSAKELLFEHPDSFPFDLLLLDIDMDGMDGMALAKEIRKKDQKLPIVFLTNRSEYCLLYTSNQPFPISRLKNSWRNRAF